MLYSIVRSLAARSHGGCREHICDAAQRWEAFLHHWIWDAWRRYFRVRGVVPPPPYCKPGKHYIFAHFPHAGQFLHAMAACNLLFACS